MAAPGLVYSVKQISRFFKDFRCLVYAEMRVYQSSVAAEPAPETETGPPLILSDSKRNFVMSLRRLLSGVAAAALLSVAGIAPVSAQSGAPEPTIQNFGTWSTRCDVNENADKRCHAFVNVAIGEDKQRLLYLGITYGPQDTDADGENELFLFAVTPLGTFLPNGIGWTIDGKQSFSQQFLFCIPGGCQTEIMLTDERLKAMKGGNQMEVVFRIVGKGDAKVPVKLDGITKAIAAIPMPKKS